MRSFSHDRFREILRGLRGGDVYERPLGRMATTTDNSWFTLLTQNTAPIHFTHAYAEKTEFGRPFVDSTFTVALVTG